MDGKANSPAEMQALGGAAAGDAKAGDVFALTGGLGAGKTHWTKGFAAGMGCPDVVTSPTFPLVHEYNGTAMPVFHFDFFRLDSPEELIALGWDEYLEAGGVIVAEWADKFPELLPPDTIRLQFTVDPDGGRTVSRING